MSRSEQSGPSHARISHNSYHGHDTTQPLIDREPSHISAQGEILTIPLINSLSDVVYDLGQDSTQPLIDRQSGDFNDNGQVVIADDEKRSPLKGVVVLITPHANNKSSANDVKSNKIKGNEKLKQTSSVEDNSVKLNTTRSVEKRNKKNIDKKIAEIDDKSPTAIKSVQVKVKKLKPPKKSGEEMQAERHR